MMGLMYLFAFIIYIVLFIGVVMGAIKVAKAKGKSKKLWGGMAAFIMYNLVFWDFLPTLLLHQYYCKKEAGFWVYKTAEQWRKENPGVVVGSIKPPEGMELNDRGNGEMVMPDGTKLVFTTYRDGHQSLEFYNSDGSDGYWLNDRFYYVTSSKKTSIVDVSIDNAKVVDVLTGKIMMEGMQVFATPENQIKIWVHYPACGPKETVLKNITNFRKI